MRLVAEPSWLLSLYPQAGEGGGSLYVKRRMLPSGGAPNVERAEEEAARRARAKIRRYAVANGLNRLGTLTYAGDGCHEPLQLRDDLASFFRRLRERLGGGRFPYLWVPQWHPGGHGLHAHFAVDRYIGRTLIDASWGHGFVHIKLLSDLPVGSGVRGEARQAARYLAPYVSRDAADKRRLQGLHRYEVAQGFQPAKIECYGESADDAIERASGYMGAPPERVWLSSQTEGWRGPPACWAQWN